MMCTEGMGATGDWDLQSRPTSGDDFSWFPNVGASSSCKGLLIASRSLLPCPFSCLHSEWDVSCLFSKRLSLLLLPVPTPCLCYQPSATSLPHPSHHFKQQNYLAKLFHGLLGTAAWLCHYSGHGTEWWIPVLGTHHLTWAEEVSAGGSAFTLPTGGSCNASNCFHKAKASRRIGNSNLPFWRSARDIYFWRFILGTCWKGSTNSSECVCQQEEEDGWERAPAPGRCFTSGRGEQAAKCSHHVFMDPLHRRTLLSSSTLVQNVSVQG